MEKLKRYKITLLCMGLLLVAVLTGLYFTVKYVEDSNKNVSYKYIQETTIQIEDIGDKLSDRIALKLSSDDNILWNNKSENKGIFITVAIVFTVIWLMLCAIVIMIKEHDKDSFYRHEATHKMID